MGGSEAVVDAEEYLQPNSRAPIPPSTSSTMSMGSGSSPPATPTKKWSGAGSMGTVVGTASTIMAESPTPQNQQNWDRELRYGQMDGHNHHPMRNHQQGIIMGFDATDSRYSSDPLKMLGRGKKLNHFHETYIIIIT
jgi:hypothetical protein